MGEGGRLHRDSGHGPDDHRAATAHRMTTGWDVSALSVGVSGSMAKTMQTNDVTSTAVQDRSRLAALLHRWPTALGIGVAALMLSDIDDGREFAIVLLIAAVGYLLIAVLERPRATWLLLAGLLLVVVGLRLLDISPEPVLAVVAVAAIVFGLIRGPLRRPWLPALQAPATLLFGTVAFIAVAAGSQVGSALVAVGLLAHAVWDVIHFRARAIVAPSLAEWCAVLDTLIAVGILVLVWT
jgi:hypothetical protein